LLKFSDKKLFLGLKRTQSEERIQKQTSTGYQIKQPEKKEGIDLPKLLQVVSVFSVLLVTFPTVDGLAFRGLERNFCFLATVGANCLVHFAWPATSSSLISQLSFTSLDFWVELETKRGKKRKQKRNVL
jgi:hypothetical protein